eukprot:TRINITY_DN12155_c0_g2_i1.p1 TRINITY_DN12155_c0_g2~~TRINITY_DN12155_c0_g2_i1.p1  ORF type:complete len:109 (+),score=21.58 TRINITY_DN12155_c0_g2_i1:171-497(+)
MGGLFTKLKELLFNKKLELVLVGLENCGKSTFANHLTYGEPKKTLPTIGLTVKYAKRDSTFPSSLDLTMRIWDLAGQMQFRSEWVSYAKTCDVIVFMVDASTVLWRRM